MKRSDGWDSSVGSDAGSKRTPKAPEMIHLGPLTIDEGAWVADLNGQSLQLTKSEFRLLTRLAREPGMVVTPRELLTWMWDRPWIGDTTSVEVHLSRLRRKLGESGGHARLIQTVRGVGYRLDISPIDPSGSLAAAYRTLEQSLATAGTVVALVSPDRTVAWVNAYVTDILGWHRDEFIGRNLLDLAHADDLPELHRVIRSTETGESQTHKARLAHSDGSYCSLTALLHPLLSADGTFLGSVSEWRLTLPEDATVELTPPSTLTATPQAAGAAEAFFVEMIYDAELILRDVLPNQPFFGWDPALVIGTPFMLAADASFAVDRASTLTFLQLLLDTGTRQLVQSVAIRHADGLSSLHDSTVTLLADESGRFRGIRAVIR